MERVALKTRLGFEARDRLVRLIPLDGAEPRKDPIADRAHTVKSLHEPAMIVRVAMPLDPPAPAYGALQATEDFGRVARIAMLRSRHAYAVPRRPALS